MQRLSSSSPEKVRLPVTHRPTVPQVSIDLLKVVKMLLTHGVLEIDAGGSDGVARYARHASLTRIARP